MMLRAYRLLISTAMLWLVLGIVLSTLVGHFFHNRVLTSWTFNQDDTEMAAITGVCFLLLTGAMLLRNWNGKGK